MDWALSVVLTAHAHMIISRGSPNCTIKALRLHLLSIEPLQNTSKRHFQWKDMDRPDSDFCSPENPLISEMKHFCKRIQEACNDLKEDLTPYRNERFYRYEDFRNQTRLCSVFLNAVTSSSSKRFYWTKYVQVACHIGCYTDKQTMALKFKAEHIDCSFFIMMNKPL